MLKQIRYFQAVARTGSFTKAAEECYISQSAISQQIRVLERELGFELIKRHNRTFSLTPAGEYFYKKSRQITEEFDMLCEEAKNISDSADNILRIGYSKLCTCREFRKAVIKFSESFPDVWIQLISGTSEDLHDALRTGKADIILNDQRRGSSEEFSCCTLAETDFYIEISSKSWIASLDSIETADLKNIPCILVADELQRNNEQSYYREVIGIESNFVFADSLEAAGLLVAGGKGFMPMSGEGHTSQFGEAISQIPLLRSGEIIKHRCCLFSRNDSDSRYIESFSELLKYEYNCHKSE